MIVVIVLLTSILLQIAAALMTLRLTKITENYWSFMLIAVAILLMALRQSITLYRLVTNDLSLPPDLAAEVLTLVLSALMMVSMTKFAPLFLSTRGSEDTLRESEARYRGVIEAFPDAVVVTDPAGHVIIANQLAASLYGEKLKDELIGRNAFEMVSMEDQQDLLQNFQENTKLDRIMRLEYSLVKKDGSTFPAEISASVIRDKENQPQAYINIIRDVTERKEAEEKIRKSEVNLIEAQRIAGLGSWEVNIVNNEIAWSDEVYRIFGYSPQEFPVTHVTFMSFVHPDDREYVQKAVDDAIAEIKPYSIDHRIVLPNGSERIVHEEAEVTSCDETGKATRMVGTIHDITSRKKAEEAIRQSEQRYRILFKHSPISIWIEDFTAVAKWLEKLRANGVTDLDTHLDNHPEMLREAISWIRVIDVNDATLKLYEIDTREGLIDNLNKLLKEIPPEDFKKQLLAIWESKTEGLKLEANGVTLKGHQLQIVLYWRAPVIDGKVDLSRVIIAITDITKRKKAEQDLKAAADTALLYLDLMGHDIRNHLQAIVMGMEIMKYMDLGVEVEQVSEIVYESVNKSQSMIGKIQSTRGLLTESVSARSLSEVLNNCLRSLRETYEDVEIELDMHVKEPVVQADEYLEFLLMNILENAVVHNDKKIRQVWVTVTEVDNGYELRIGDNGPSLSESKKEVLFDPERRYGGIGIHQAMIIARKYNARVSVRDRIAGNPSEGAEFLIWFPNWT